MLQEKGGGGALQGSRTTESWDKHLLAIWLKRKLGGWGGVVIWVWPAGWPVGKGTLHCFSDQCDIEPMNLCKELAQVLTFLTIGWRLF